MQTVVGRLTADAKVASLKDGRQVVNFSIAQNDRFKVKGSEEVKQVTNFFNCSYWMNSSIAAHLKKGMVIETAGRIGVNAWQSTDGSPKASLTLHVQFIQFHSKGTNTSSAAKAAQATSEDLPF